MRASTYRRGRSTTTRPIGAIRPGRSWPSARGTGHSPRLDADRRQESLRTYCRELRAWYRGHPGMPALARAEGPFASADPLRRDDILVGFFPDLGLSPQNASRAWSITILQVSGFAAIREAWHDRPPPGSDPAGWTGVPPSPAPGELPHLRRIAAESESEPPDVLFESVLTMLVAGVESMGWASRPTGALGCSRRRPPAPGGSQGRRSSGLQRRPGQRASARDDLAAKGP
ncbi:TetR/AcrR family transcriptional regulator C-terminal domain-containing protein [Streptomyces sp. NPDC052069]|uniref:TetR/AcrR family transcriptional regulator C-terminal domain-containing protein n=1 Tax=Streptomyces sp. NPDC052069 TaxID=3154650 RepID=UPI0034322476